MRLFLINAGFYLGTLAVMIGLSVGGLVALDMFEDADERRRARLRAAQPESERTRVDYLHPGSGYDDYQVWRRRWTSTTST